MSFFSRFKTRNTYKRHLKTRHGKILTTVGEVFHLSEEDFQKVRTNRRKKDCVPEVIMNVDDVASNVIVDFGNHHDKVVTNPVEEYVLKENIDGIDSNWETKGTVQAVDKCYETFEICSESELNKTDGIETEVVIDCRYPDSNIEMECINDGQNGLLELKNSFYGNIKETNNEENEIIYQHNIDQNKAFDCSNEISCEYSEINCNDEIVTKDDITTRQVNIEFPEKQNSSSHVMQKSIHDYHYQGVNDNDMPEKSSIYMHLKTEDTEATSSKENDQKHDDTHVIITKDNAIDEKSSKYANSFDIENKKCIGNNIAFCTQVSNTNVNISPTIVKEVILQNDTSQENKCVCKYIAPESIKNVNVSAKEINQKVDDQNNRYLYIRNANFLLNEPLSKKLTQSKCINIPLHQIKLCRELQAKKDGKKIRILNGNLRVINIKQSDKQNAILLVSGDNLKDQNFQIDKSNISAEGLKR